MSNPYKCFDFLKEGHDKQFQSAMNSIDSMYDNLFNGDKLDKLFENLKYEDNPITQPIDDMTKYIFKTDEKPKGPVYVKTQTPKTSHEDDDFVVGEPLYQNEHKDNPYANNHSGNYHYNHPNNAQPGYQQMNNNFTNPYYQSSGENNYFGTWQQKPTKK